jgi:hypothetical protein
LLGLFIEARKMMLVGHYAIGFFGKKLAPRASLGVFVLAAMAADILWCAFMLAGVEQVEFTSGRGAGQYFRAVTIGLSHGLAMDLLWAALLAAGVYLFTRYARGAVIVFFAVLSHWVLDVVSHRPDMPIGLGPGSKLGLGMWSSVPITLLVEGGFWILALIVYARSHLFSSRARLWGFGVGSLILTVIWSGNITGPPPTDTRSASMFSLFIFSISVVWAYWIDRPRNEICSRIEHKRAGIATSREMSESYRDSKSPRYSIQKSVIPA